MLWNGLQALDQRKLQKESTERLNGFMEELRNDVSAELSAKNLGDEGCAYIAEGLAFNDRCLQCMRGNVQGLLSIAWA